MMKELGRGRRKTGTPNSDESKILELQEGLKDAHKEIRRPLNRLNQMDQSIHEIKNEQKRIEEFIARIEQWQNDLIKIKAEQKRAQEWQWQKDLSESRRPAPKPVTCSCATYDDAEIFKQLEELKKKQGVADRIASFSEDRFERQLRALITRVGRVEQKLNEPVKEQPKTPIFWHILGCSVGVNLIIVGVKYFVGI